jgi:hypothetical protein
MKTPISVQPRFIMRYGLWQEGINCRLTAHHQRTASGTALGRRSALGGAAQEVCRWSNKLVDPFFPTQVVQLRPTPGLSKLG